jgi:3-hydroxy-9,10-secoandrosta-1,3,5(10)-triene-9,17-dione monooxygenase
MSAVEVNKSETPSVTGPELVERARALTPLLAAHAAQAEKERKPVDSVIKAIEDAEIYKLMVPKCYGGLELDMDTFFDVGVALGEGDASMAWVSNFYIEHNWIFCHFPEAFQKELFASRTYVLAPAIISPTATVTPEKDGFRINGRWQWGTGIMHGDWVIPSATEISPDGKPIPRWFALPTSEVTVEDTWYVDGMSGTGSNDVVIDNVFIPAERVTEMGPMMSGHGPASEIHEGPLYRTPMMPILTLAATMPALGQAKSVVRYFREHLGERSLLDTSKQIKRSASMMRLARAEVDVCQTELLLRHLVEDVCIKRNTATLEDRARWATQLATAVHQCKQTIQNVVEASGAHAHFQDSPLQRAQRDVNTLSCHYVFDLDGKLDAYGRLLLGQELEGGAFF